VIPLGRDSCFDAQARLKTMFVCVCVCGCSQYPKKRCPHRYRSTGSSFNGKKYRQNEAWGKQLELVETVAGPASPLVAIPPHLVGMCGCIRGRDKLFRRKQ